MFNVNYILLFKNEANNMATFFQASCRYVLKLEEYCTKSLQNSGNISVAELEELCSEG
jgi:hypothetical protein